TTQAPTAEPILEVSGLVKHYPLTRGIVFRKQTPVPARVFPAFFSRGCQALPKAFPTHQHAT
ncbi:hypothetical protein ABZS63_35680, partial [Streptomyces sp. NPDC005568]